MKPKQSIQLARISRNLRTPGSTLAILLAGMSAANAAPVNKANNNNNLDTPGSWVGGGLPGPGDVASWTSLVTTANSTLLGSNLSWGGISITNPGGPVTIGAGNILTLGSSGVDMGTANRDLTIQADLSLAAGGQTWEVASGRNLTIGGSLSRTPGATVNIDRIVESGSVTASPTLQNGIVGPWVGISNPGASTGGQPDGDTYATVSGGTLVPYIGASQLTAATAWGGMSAGGDSTINHDLTQAATFGSFGFPRFPNTVRYTGMGSARQPGNTPNADLISLNGFMNAGNGTFTFGVLGAGVPNDRPYNVVIGPSRELVLAAMTGGITLLNPIKDNPGGASAVTVTGFESVTLSGVSSYSGATTVAGGTLRINESGTINNSSGLTINGAEARYVHTSSAASTVPITLIRGSIEGSGTLGAITVGDDADNLLALGGGTLNLASLSFAGEAAVDATLSGPEAAITLAGALSTTPANGKVTLTINAPILANGVHPVIDFGSFAGSAGDFTVDLQSGINTRQSAGLVIDGNRIALEVSGEVPTWTGALDGRWTTAALSAPKNWKLTPSNAVTDFLSDDNVVFDDGATGTTTVEISDGDIWAGNVEFRNNSKAYTLSGTTYGLASGSLIKGGTGALTIDAANYHNGGMRFTGGTLNLKDGNALGNGTFTIDAGSPKILNNTAGFDLPGPASPPQIWNDDFTFAGSSALDLGNGPVTLGGDDGKRVVTVSAGTLTVGEIKSATHGLVKQGPGTLVAASTGPGDNASVIAGTLEVSEGTLQMNRPDAMAEQSGDFTVGGLAGTGTIVNGAATERWLFVNTVDDQTFTGTLANGGAGALGFNKQGGGSLTLSGILSHTGATTVAGGTLTIPVANTGPGTNATVNSGTLVMAHPSAFGDAGTIRLGGNNVATLDIATDGGNNDYGIVFGSGTIATVISNRATPGPGINHTLGTFGTNGVGGGTITVSSGSNVTSGSGRLTFTEFGLSAGTMQTTILNPTNANITLGNVSKVANAPVQTLELAGISTENVVSGVISDGTAIVSLIKSNSGTWTLSNTNTYTGSTTIGTANSAGVLRATADGALGSGTVWFDPSGGNPGPTSRLEIEGGITLGNTMNLSQRNNTSALILNTGGDNTLGGTLSLSPGGAQATIASAAGRLTLTGAVTVASTSTRNLRLDGAGDGEISGTMSNDAVNPGGVLNVTKVGSGTWTLSGTRTHTGTTTVGEGTLVILGDSSAATGAVSVAPGATLTGSGPLGGDVIIGADGRLAFDVAASPAAQPARAIAGVLDLNAFGDILTLTASSPPAEGTYVLATAAGGISGHSGGTLDDTVIELAGLTGTVSVSGNNLLVTVGDGGPSAYSSWASAFGLNPLGDGAPGVDKDDDGFINATEFLLGGSPVSGAIHPEIHSLLADTSADADSARELVLTIAVPVGTPAFPAGSPASSVFYEGFGITVRGGTDLQTFGSTVTPVNPITTGLPPAPVRGGVSYEYRSFSLGGSNGLPGKGFLQVFVDLP